MKTRFLGKDKLKVSAIASGVWTAGSVRNTDYPQQAYQLGRSL